MSGPTDPERLDPREILRLDTFAAGRITSLARALDAGAPEGQDSVELAEAAAAMAAALPTRLLRAVHRYRNTGGPHDVLLIRSLAIPSDLGPTPTTAVPDDVGRAARIGALTLLGVMTLLGEPFTFRSLHQGRIVQHVVPIRGQEDAQTSGGSATFLDWHVEDAHTDDRCDYAGLLCLRGHPAATTLYAPLRRAALDDDRARVLRQARFVVVPDIAHGAVEPLDPTPVPVLTGPDRDAELCYDALYMRPLDPDDTEAAGALVHARAALGDAAVGHVLEPGDLLIMDNRRGVHARTLFPACGDGTDRWLMRAMVCASPRAHRRRGAPRALG